MFKHFTWAKFLADVGVVGAIVTGPLAGLIGTHVAEIVVAAGVAIRAIASLVTTVKSGHATDVTGQPVSKS